MKRIDTATRAVDLFGPGKDGFKDGNLGLGVAPTDLNADAFNGYQEELANVIEGAGLVLSGADLTQLRQAIKRLAGGRDGCRGLVGGNNSGTPNTQFDIKADAVTFRNPATGETSTVAPVAVLTNNILTAGPAANGRDQAGAFGASSWVHFYFIYNPTTATVATISSATAPPVGPALPAGYTSWAYAGVVYLSAGSALASVTFRGAWANYTASQASVVNSTATVSTAVSTATAVPPNALELKILVINLGISTTAGGLYGLTLFLEVVSGSGAYQCGLQGTGPASVSLFVSGGSAILPNVGQNYYHRLSIGSGAGPITSINIGGYKMPNGGE